MLIYGSTQYQNLFKQMRLDGLVHAAELKKPALRREDKRYYDAFRSLSASRMWSQVGPSPIQVSEVDAYMNMCGITDSETKLKYLRLIQGLDIVERTHIQANVKK